MIDDNTLIQLVMICFLIAAYIGLGLLRYYAEVRDIKRVKR